MPTRKIYTNTLAQIAAKVLTALISIAMIKILTNYLDIAGYGLYSKIYNYISIFAVIADLGLYTITVRELSAHADDPKMLRKISGNILSLRTISGGIIILTSLLIGFFLPGYGSLEAMIGIGIAGLFTLAGLINSSLMSYLQAMLRTEFTLIANTAGKLLTFGMILMFATFFISLAHTEKFTLVMLAGLAGNILMTALTWWYVSRYQKVEFLWETAYIKHIITLSLPYGVALFLNVIFFKVDTILLSIMSPRALADTIVALYALPMKIVEVGMMYGTIFLNSLLPVLTQAIEKGDQKKMYSLTSNAWNILLTFGMGISILGFLFAPEIIRIISSEDFLLTSVLGYTSIEAFRIVIWIFLFYFLSSLFTYLLIARGEQKKMLLINAIVAGLNIIGNILVIEKFSFIGSAWVTLFSQVILLFITGLYTWKNLPGKKLFYSAVLIIAFALLGYILLTYTYMTINFIDTSTFYGAGVFFLAGSILFSIIYLGGIYLVYKLTKYKRIFGDS